MRVKTIFFNFNFQTKKLFWIRQLTPTETWYAHMGLHLFLLGKTKKTKKMTDKKIF